MLLLTKEIRSVLVVVLWSLWFALMTHRIITEAIYSLTCWVEKVRGDHMKSPLLLICRCPCWLKGCINTLLSIWFLYFHRQISQEDKNWEHNIQELQKKVKQTCIKMALVDWVLYLLTLPYFSKVILLYDKKLDQFLSSVESAFRTPRSSDYFK